MIEFGTEAYEEWVHEQIEKQLYGQDDYEDD